MDTVNHINLYFDTCALHMYTPFKKYFITLNEENTVGTLNWIDSGLTIWFTGTVKYIMLDDTIKPYTMMVEEYWVPELKHQLLSPQFIHTEEGNPMSFHTYYVFEGEYIFSGLMVKPKVKGYHRHLDLKTTMMQYNRRNNLPIHSA